MFQHAEELIYVVLWSFLNSFWFWRVFLKQRQRDVACLFNACREWPWRTAPSTGPSLTASAWLGTQRWTWSQATASHLGCLKANSCMYLWICWVLSYIQLTFMPFSPVSQCGTSEAGGVFILSGPQWEGGAVPVSGCFGWRAGKQLVSGVHSPGDDLC